MYDNDTQIPRKAQQGIQNPEYNASLMFNAIHVYGLSGDEITEYIQIEKRLDVLDALPFPSTNRRGERKALMARHAELTSPKNIQN